MNQHMTTPLTAAGTLPRYPDLEGKVALVTGGSRGIGAVTCRLLAANGVKVAVNGRDQEAINATVTGITTAGGAAIGIAADCTDFAAIEAMRGRIEEELGPVDILAAFAGGQGSPVPTEELTEERWREVLDADLTSMFLTVRSILPGMIARRRGVIVTMASSAARAPARSNIAYAAAKAGVVMFSRHLANEVGKHGIRVNCVAPGAILTPDGALARAPEAVQQEVAVSHPLGRAGTPEDVALATLFLASDSSSWLTGLTVDIAGGRIMV